MTPSQASYHRRAILNYNDPSARFLLGNPVRFCTGTPDHQCSKLSTKRKGRGSTIAGTPVVGGNRKDGRTATIR